MKRTGIQYFNDLKSGARLTICTAIALIVGLFLSLSQTVVFSAVGAWIAFSVCHLVIAWVTILTCSPAMIDKIAARQDAGRTTMTLFILIAAGASVIAVLLLYGSAKDKSGFDLLFHILFSVTSVATAWTMVHTTLAFKYAHLYYNERDRALEFPGETHPDYMDFVYFSFVIGSTFQVSDVQVVSKHIRKIVWLHGVLSFAFNTVILALTINIISGLIDN